MPVHLELLPPPPGAQRPVAVLRLDRPEKAHAYDRDHLDALDEALQRALAAAPGALVLESTGDGAFCGGADLGELRAAPPQAALDLWSQQVFDRLARAPVVSIAAVHGPAVAGGCELALACDLRVVGPRARFALPETALGLVPAAGGTTRLRHLVGASVARQVILGGRALDADQAVGLGLALGPEADPRAAARALAWTVAARDPLALRLAKELLAPPGEAEGLRAERLAEAVLYGRRGG